MNAYGWKEGVKSAIENEGMLCSIIYSTYYDSYAVTISDSQSKREYNVIPMEASGAQVGEMLVMRFKQEMRQS